MSTLQFLYRFIRSAQDVAHEREVVFPVEGDSRSATLYLPQSQDRRAPAWVLLQGVTVPGRHHAGVRRMARALAAAGHMALVPEVPTWTDLRVDPREAEPTVRGALAYLEARPDADRERHGLMGFSVAGTWALEVAGGAIGRDLRVVVGMGGYADPRRMIRAMVVGEHEWRGRRYRYRPDPYGRWILGADLLPRLAGQDYGTQSERESAARALHRLARTAGRNGAMAESPVYDTLIRQLRGFVPEGARPAWDLFAPTSDQGVPDREAGTRLADALARAGTDAYPGLDPAGRLFALRTPVVLLHGRGDTLIPFTETLRLASQLPRRPRHVAVTRIVGHAKTEEATIGPNPLAWARELWSFGRTVRAMLRAVG